LFINNKKRKRKRKKTDILYIMTHERLDYNRCYTRNNFGIALKGGRRRLKRVHQR